MNGRSKRTVIAPEAGKHLAVSVERVVHRTIGIKAGQGEIGSTCDTVARCDYLAVGLNGNGVGFIGVVSNNPQGDLAAAAEAAIEAPVGVVTSQREQAIHHACGNDLTVRLDSHRIGEVDASKNRGHFTVAVEGRVKRTVSVVTGQGKATGHAINQLVSRSDNFAVRLDRNGVNRKVDGQSAIRLKRARRIEIEQMIAPTGNDRAVRLDRNEID